MTSARPLVSLVGAGPGDPGLLTLRGRERLQHADVVLTDALVSPDLLALCPPDAHIIHVGKRGFQDSWSQDDINTLLVQQALEDGGKRVVRLKGGDPFVFGRGGEEMLACRAAGVACEVVPGISSALAGPALAGVPVTHRGLARSFAVLTGSDCQGPAHYRTLLGVDTLVILMGARHLGRLAAELQEAGWSPQTPALSVQWASEPRQRQVSGTLADIAERARSAGLGAPAVTVIGDVAALSAELGPVARPLPLLGRSFAVVRTRAAGSRLAAMLRGEGADVTEVPLVQFAPTGKRAEVAGTLRSHAGWLVFSAEQAVDELAHLLLRLGLDLRALAHLRLAAVGQGTASRLQRYGLRADHVPQPYGARHLADSLPAEPGEVVVHAGTQDPDHVLAAGLEARGLGYHLMEVYRQEAADLGPEHLRALSSAERVVVASSAGAQQLARTDQQYPLMVIGPQTAAAARALGFTDLQVAADASLEGVVRALLGGVE